MKILGKPSSINVRKVLWTCAEIGIDYGHEHAPDKALLPRGLVPVVLDAGHTLTESNSICRYLAGKHARPDLLPLAPLPRAQVEAWMDWQASEFNSAWRYAFMALVRQSPSHTDAAQIAASVAQWNQQAAVAAVQLAHGPFMCGEVFTLADIVVALSLQRWRVAPIERPVLPVVDAYLARMAERAGPVLSGHP